MHAKGSVPAAAEAIGRADALLIAAGAGMSVDSGLPAYRGNEGFWNAYPPYRDLRLDYADLATPRGLDTDPEFAWGFFGHQLQLYRSAVPHSGFKILLSIAQRMPRGYFVITTNIDGQFLKAGYPADRVHECHGSIHRLQCHVPCRRQAWPATDVRVTVDEETMLARPPMPRCPYCGSLARPNVFLFGDTRYVWEPAQEDADRFRHWLERNEEHRFVILEIGSGTGAPGLRLHCEKFAANIKNSMLIRVNLTEAQVPRERDISLSMTSLDALTSLGAALL